MYLLDKYLNNRKKDINYPSSYCTSESWSLDNVWSLNGTVSSSNTFPLAFTCRQNLLREDVPARVGHLALLSFRNFPFPECKLHDGKGFVHLVTIHSNA